ncbi:MAG: molybdate ABC transporter substrate-binding protein [Paracoccaceae bacterium]
MKMNRTAQILCIWTLVVAPQTVAAETALIAVATNFSEVMDVLVSDFEAGVNHELTIVTGSTGKMYAQIVNGAPFDAFLAADQARPALLVENGQAIENSRFTFAMGQIVLFSADPSRIGEEIIETLTNPFRHLAIANPTLAPYGIAAIEALTALNLLSALQNRIVMGENIGQTHALVASGNAELGIVALAYAISTRNEVGSYLPIPTNIYAPIHQDAVLTMLGKDNPAAVAFLAYLQSKAAQTIIRSHGYGVE